MKLQTERKLLDTFSFSSLTDIVFLLLIFFLLSSSFIIQPGIKVKLPKAEASEEVLEKSVTVTIAKNSLYYLNDIQIPIAELGARLNSLMKENPSEIVIIKADEDEPISRLVKVMSICKEVGYNISIATEPTNG